MPMLSGRWIDRHQPIQKLKRAPIPQPIEPNPTTTRCVGIQLPRDLGLRRVQLLTNNPQKTGAFIYGGFDLEVNRVPILPPANEHNERPLATKRETLGRWFPGQPFPGHISYPF